MGGLQLKNVKAETKFCLEMLVDSSLSYGSKNHRGGAPCPARSSCLEAEDRKQVIYPPVLLVHPHRFLAFPSWPLMN